jgi:hypothetical protein
MTMVSSQMPQMSHMAESLYQNFPKIGLDLWSRLEFQPTPRLRTSHPEGWPLLFALASVCDSSDHALINVAWNPNATVRTFVPRLWPVDDQDSGLILEHRGHGLTGEAGELCDLCNGQRRFERQGGW